MSILRDRRGGMVWLAARLWVGWTFLNASWGKITGDGWFNSTAAIDGYLKHAASSESTTGAHAPVATWFAALINHVFLPIDGFLSYFVPICEFALGIGLIFGALSTLAAFFGGLLVLLFMLSGTLSTGVNPFMLSLQVLLLGAGAAAYVYGVDRYLLPALGALWRKVTRRPRSPQAERTAPERDRGGRLDPVERTVRVLLGVALLLIAWGYSWSGEIGIGAIVVGGIALITGAAGICLADNVLARLDERVLTRLERR
jgi:thiosulfate dehydrogenase [quinone] large subunit